jgi:Mannitol dehydrogenase C-terminal domain
MIARTTGVSGRRAILAHTNRTTPTVGVVKFSAAQGQADAKGREVEQRIACQLFRPHRRRPKRAAQNLKQHRSNQNRECEANTQATETHGQRIHTVILIRFSNPNIAHETYQIAMDGTEKLPQRIFEPALVAQGQGQPLRPYAFATAAWMRYCSGRTDGGTPYALRDPKQQEIIEILRNCAVPEKLADRLFNLKGLFPEKLLSDRNWTTQVTSILSVITGKGMREWEGNWPCTARPKNYYCAGFTRTSFGVCN